MTSLLDYIIDPALTAPLRSGELTAIAREWGIDAAILRRLPVQPANALGRAASFDPAKWDGWQYEAIVGPKRPAGLSRPPWMITLAIRANDTGEVINYQLFEAAIWPNYAALAKWKPDEGWPRLVRRYHPGGTDRPLATMDVRHATVWTRPATINATWRGRPLLAQVGEPRGGRRRGWRKGRVWSRDAVINWKGDCDLDEEPATLFSLAEAFGVKSPQTVRQRLRELEPPLPWPPEQHPNAWDPYPNVDDE